MFQNFHNIDKWQLIFEMYEFVAALLYSTISCLIELIHGYTIARKCASQQLRFQISQIHLLVLNGIIFFWSNKYKSRFMAMNTFERKWFIAFIQIRWIILIWIERGERQKKNVIMRTRSANTYEKNFEHINIESIRMETKPLNSPFLVAHSFCFRFICCFIAFCSLYSIERWFDFIRFCSLKRKQNKQQNNSTNTHTPPEPKLLPPCPIPKLEPLTPDKPDPPGRWYE